MSDNIEKIIQRAAVEKQNEFNARRKRQEESFEKATQYVVRMFNKDIDVSERVKSYHAGRMTNLLFGQLCFSPKCFYYQKLEIPDDWTEDLRSLADISQIFQSLEKLKIIKNVNEQYDKMLWQDVNEDDFLIYNYWQSDKLDPSEWLYIKT